MTDNIEKYVDMPPLKMAVLITGEPPEFELTYKSISTWLEGYEYDVFIHAWNTTSTPANNGAMSLIKEETEIEYEKDYLIDTFTKYYKPAGIRIETKDEFIENVLPKYPFVKPKYYTKIRRTNAMALCQMYSIQEGVNLIPNIEDYDLIIRTRFDILFNRKGDISKIVHMIMKHKHNIDTPTPEKSYTDTFEANERIKHLKKYRHKLIITSKFHYTYNKFFVYFTNLFGMGIAMKELFGDYLDYTINGDDPEVSLQHSRCHHDLLSKCIIKKGLTLRVSGLKQAAFVKVRPGCSLDIGNGEDVNLKQMKQVRIHMAEYNRTMKKKENRKLKQTKNITTDDLYHPNTDH